jgi:hypothetical protein
MHKRNLLKTMTTGAAFVAVLVLGMSVVPSRGRAENDNNGAQDEKQMIETGLTVAATSGIHLNTAGKDQDMADWEVIWSMWPPIVTVATPRTLPLSTPPSGIPTC